MWENRKGKGKEGDRTSASSIHTASLADYLSNRPCLALQTKSVILAEGATVTPGNSQRHMSRMREHGYLTSPWLLCRGEL